MAYEEWVTVRLRVFVGRVSLRGMAGILVRLQGGHSSRHRGEHARPTYLMR